MHGEHFLHIVTVPILPSPFPLEASIGGSPKESRIPERLLEVVDLEIVLLLYVVRIDEKKFSSIFVPDCGV